MKSVVRRIWASGYDLEHLRPGPGGADYKVPNTRDDFYVEVQLEIGYEGDPKEGVEVFTVGIGSPSRAYERPDIRITKWDWPLIETELRRQFTVSGNDWEDILGVLQKRGHWEFENYRQRNDA